MSTRKAMMVMGVVCFAGFGVGCAKKQVRTTPTLTKVTKERVVKEQVAKKAPTQKEPQVVQEPQVNVPDELPKKLTMVHFDYNKYVLTPSAKQRLQKHIKWLRTHDDVNIKISGHCDQRGSVEYNLFLGERRAKAIKTYLTTMGIKESRLSIISYGHQRPLSSKHTQEAYAKNRRGEFKIMQN